MNLNFQAFDRVILINYLHVLNLLKSVTQKSKFIIGAARGSRVARMRINVKIIIQLCKRL